MMGFDFADASLYEHVFDDAPIGLIVADRDFRVVRVNRRMAELLGRPESAIIGRRTHEFTYEPDRGNIAELIAAMLADGRRAGQTLKRYVHADGTILPARVSLSIVGDDNGDPLFYIGQAQDISEEIRSQSEAARQQAAAERAAAELGRFAYAASHDLQEPLRVLSVCVEMLDREYAGQLDEQARELIAYAADSAQHMTAIIDDLLDLARVSADQSPHEPVDLNDVADSALRHLHVAVEEKQPQIRRSDLPTVRGHRGQLTRMLTNLLSNALKFSHSDRRPEVRITSEAVDGGWRIDVSDNGIGIPSEQKEEVFRAFRRLQPADQYPGTGIGLTISQKIVELHSGRISVNSRAGEGATFHVWLPSDPARITVPVTATNQAAHLPE